VYACPRLALAPLRNPATFWGLALWGWDSIRLACRPLVRTGDDEAPDERGRAGSARDAAALGLTLEPAWEWVVDIGSGVSGPATLRAGGSG
jgi:hypothetical protein